MDQCETSGDATSMLHPHTLTLPFPTIWSEENQIWTYKEGCHSDRMGFWSRQGSCIPCISSHPSDHYLTLAQRCELFNPYVLFPLLRQPPFLLPKKDSGPFSNNFQRLTQYMQNISEPEQIKKIFLEMVRFYRLAKASRWFSSMQWKSLLWTIICCFLSHSATSGSARTFVFQQTLQTIVHSVLFGTAVLILTGKKQAITLKTHGLVTGTAEQCGDSKPPSTRVSWCHCQQHDQALPLPFSNHPAHTATVRGYLSHNSSKL